MWLHSSVGRATHRQRGGHGFESRWSPDFFHCLNWKIYCDDHSLLSLLSLQLSTFKADARFSFYVHQTGRKSLSYTGIFRYNKEGKPLSRCPQYTIFTTSQILHKYRPQLLLYECNTQLRDQIIDRFSKADNATNVTSNINAKSARKGLNVPFGARFSNYNCAG